MNSLHDVLYMTFDVVGTLIDFEAGLTECLCAIGREAGVEVDAEAALAHYRAARHMPEVGRFPDDLARVYGVIAPALGLPADPALGRRLRDSVPGWKPFPDSAEALARLGRYAKLIAMTNAQRWALEHFERALGMPFQASFTTDDTGTEKPDPAFFHQVMASIEREGGSRAQLLHVAQSQYHDIGVTRALGWTNCWIQRRYDREGYGGSIAPERFTEPDHHFTTLAGLADAMDQSRAA
jgi:putative hydrolase of the HAD superfamily